MPRAHDPFGVNPDRQPGRGMGGPIPNFGQYTDFTDTWGLFIDGLLKQIKDWTGIDLYWLLDWSWTTNSLLELVRQANDLFAWLQNPIQRPPNLLSRPGFSSPSAIAAAPDWSWDPVVSLGTVEGPYGVLRTDPQGSAMTTADGSRHSMLSNAISEPVALTPGQILVCQVHALVEAGFTASDDQAIRLELVPSRFGVLQDAVVIAHCGVPVGDPGDWVAAPVGSKAVFFDVDYTVPVEDSPDTVELRLVVGESAGGDVPVRFDGARVAAAGGFLVVLADLFDAGRVYLTALWDAVTAWLEDVFDADHWTALKTDTDAAFDVFVRQVKRALHHADADIFHPPSTSSILSNVLKSNPWFGWLFDMVDSWLQPVLLIGKAGTAFWETVWHAVTAFAEAPTASGAWSTLTDAIQGAWESLVDDILEAWGSVKTHADFASPGTATMAALRNNDWFGWLFDLIDTWLQPVLRIGKALTDFGDDLWHAVTTYVANPLASGAWPALVNALNDAWNDMVDAILNAWGSPKTHADFASPAAATEAALKHNPITGWLWGDSFDGGEWLTNALEAATGPVRKAINSAIQFLGLGYFDDGWIWKTGDPTSDDLATAPSTGGGWGGSRFNPLPGGGMGSIVDPSIPAPPASVSLAWEATGLTGTFPSGNIFYTVTSVKDGVEGPPCGEALIWVAGLGTAGVQVIVTWPAVSGVDGYNLYRRVASSFGDVAYRRLNSSLLTVLTYTDTTIKTGGTVAHPATPAEIDALAVTTKVDVVDAKAENASDVADAASSAAGAASSAAASALAAAELAQDTADALTPLIDASNTALRQLHAAIIAAYGGPPSSQAEVIDTSQYSDLINAGKSLESIAKSGQTLGMNNASVLSIRNNKPLYQGVDSTSETSFPLPILGTSPPFFPATPDEMNVGFLRVMQDSEFNMVSWLGYGTAFTSFWVEIFKMDIHGNMQAVYISPDLMIPDEDEMVGVDTSPDFAWNYHRLTTPIKVKAGEIYGVAFEIGGIGAAYNVVGNASWAPDHPYINPRTPGMAFDWSGLVWGFAEDFSYEVEPTDLTATIETDTFIRGAGPDQILFMREDPPAMFRMNIRNFGAATGYSNIEEIALPENVSGDALAVFADADSNFYFLQNTPERIVQRVSADGSATWMTVVTDIEGVDPDLPQLNFSVGGMVVFPGGRVVLYENDHARLLSLDLNTFTWYEFPVDPVVDEVTAMCLNPQASLLFIWNESTQEIIWFSTRNYEMLGWRVITIPSGYSVADILADADGFAYLSLHKDSLDGCVLVRAHLGTGAVQFVSATPSTPPTTIADVLVSGTGRMCVVNDRDFVAVDDDKVVVHRNVHYYDVADADMESGEPLPWFALGTLSDAESLLLPPASYDPAVPYPDVLVKLDTSGARTTIPDWVNTVFLIGVGAGGGGGGGYGQSSPFRYGRGGNGGAISIVTAYRGVHFLPGQDVWALVGQGGNGGAHSSATGTNGTAGGNGGATRINIGFTIDAVIAAGGTGGAGASTTVYGLENQLVTDSYSGVITIENAAAGHAAGNTIEVRNDAGTSFEDVVVTTPVNVKVASSQVVLGGANRAGTSGIAAGVGAGGGGGMRVSADAPNVLLGYGKPGGPGGAWVVFSQRIV